VGTATASPYSVPLDPQWTGNGSHSLLAIAQDPSNDRAASAAVAVTTSAADTTPPAAPAVLEGFAAAPTEVDLQWSAAVDNVGVSAYQVVRDGVVIATVTTTSFADTGVGAGTSSTYQVVAVDAAGNVSAPSTLINVTTMASVAPTPTPTPTPIATPTPTPTATPTPTPMPAASGSISGTVSNSRGAVAGCTVKVAGSGQTYSTTTSSSGAFLLGNLAPGTYTVTASSKSSSASTTTTVTAGATSTVTITLKK